MKVKGRNCNNKNFNVEKIHIDTLADGRVLINYTINGQNIEQIVSFVYLESVLFALSDFIDTLSQSNIINE